MAIPRTGKMQVGTFGQQLLCYLGYFLVSVAVLAFPKAASFLTMAAHGAVSQQTADTAFLAGVLLAGFSP